MPSGRFGSKTAFQGQVRSGSGKDSTGSKVSGLKQWLWDELHDLFLYDSAYGPLLEICIDFVDSTAVIAGYILLREHATEIVGKCPSFCTERDAVECVVDSIPNAAAIVVAGQAKPFYIALYGLEFRGIAIPNLGLLVEPNRLTLTYRMAREWGPLEVSALFDLLGALAALDPKASISHDDTDMAVRFQVAWRRWAMRRSVTGAPRADRQ